MKVFPNQGTNIGTSHPIFLYVEKRFFQWIERAPQDVKDMYYSEDAIYDKRGAIEQAIDNAIEAAKEANAPVDLRTFDIECAFE
jgi:hypothetical protein